MATQFYNLLDTDGPILGKRKAEWPSDFETNPKKQKIDFDTTLASSYCDSNEKEGFCPYGSLLNYNLSGENASASDWNTTLDYSTFVQLPPLDEGVNALTTPLQHNVPTLPVSSPPSTVSNGHANTMESLHSGKKAVPVSFRVAVPGKTRGTPAYSALVAMSVPYNEVTCSSRTVLWCILDAENATMNVLRKNGSFMVPCKEKKEPHHYHTEGKNYTLYKWSPQRNEYQIQWDINGTEVVSVNMNFSTKLNLSKSADCQLVRCTNDVGLTNRTPMSCTVNAQLPANYVPTTPSADLPLANSVNALFVVSDDELHDKLTTALLDLDFEMQVSCNDDQLCLYSRRGLNDDNIVLLKYEAPRDLKVISECAEVVDEMLFLLPSTGDTISISSISGRDGSRPLEVKQFEDRQGTVSFEELPRYLAQALRHSLDCCKNVKTGAALCNASAPEEISAYLAAWIARCVPRHRNNIYLCFKLKHDSATPITQVASAALEIIRMRVDQLNAKGHAYGCIAVFVVCSPLQRLFISKERHNICLDMEAQGLVLTSIYQMDISDVETMLKDKRNKPFTLPLFDLICEMLHNGVPRHDKLDHQKVILVSKHGRDILQQHVDNDVTRLFQNAHPTDESEFNDPPTSFGIYDIDLENIKLGTKLGEGGYGEVYKASWEGRNVAVKKFKSPIVHDEAFRSEVMASLSVQHRNIVKSFGVVEEGDNLMVVREFAETSLSELLSNRATLSRLQIARDIAEGLRHLHNQRIVHRDLKSENVLLYKYRRAKLTDFGTARFLGSKDTYGMAPEVPDNKSFDEKTDVYSFGALMYSLFTNKHLPILEEHQRIKWIKRNIKDPKLQRLIISCCRTDPTERPSMQQCVTTLLDTDPRVVKKLAGALTNMLHPIKHTQDIKARSQADTEGPPIDKTEADQQQAMLDVLLKS